MLVIGSSDTSGESLPDPSRAWPQLVGAELSAHVGEPVDVVNLPVVHVGPKAVPRVTTALEKHQPDLVVFAFGAYSFIVAEVGLRVRRRYGERVYGVFRKLELRFEGLTANPDGGRARLNRAGRWLARRVIGAETLGTKEEVRGIQLEIMRQLSQRERMVVAILMAPPLGAALARENPKANGQLEEHREYMTAEARRLHFLIADCIPGFAAQTSQAALRHSDSVHKSTAGHRIQADAVLVALLSAPSPLAAAARAWRDSLERE